MKKKVKPMTDAEYAEMMDENDGTALECPYCRGSNTDFVDGEWSCLDCKKTWYTQMEYLGYKEGV